MAVDQKTQSESARLSASKQEHVARGVATSPIFVARAHGARLTDVDGREYIDFVGGIGTLSPPPPRPGASWGSRASAS